MDLDTQTLKESRLGPVVLFYTKSKRVTPAINRQADALVQAWSRPIIKRPSNFRSKHVETLSEAVETQRRERMDVDGEGDEDAFEERQAAAYAAPRKKKRFDVRAALQENEGRKGARLYLNKVSTNQAIAIFSSCDSSRTSNTLLRPSHRPSITERTCRMSRVSRWTTRSSTSSRGR
jgi:transcription factor SPN1